ncbi:MAG: hypothetical protein AB7N80_08615 [Bdellovibrionales bacterium]
MNVFKCLTLALGIFLAGPGVAAELPLKPTNKKNPQTERPVPFPKITCANLEGEFSKLKTMTSQRNEGVAGYMDEVIATIDKWHKELVNMEGQSVNVPVGKFSPMLEMQKQIGESQSEVWNTNTILEARFDEMLDVLPSCLKK